MGNRIHGDCRAFGTDCCAFCISVWHFALARSPSALWPRARGSRGLEVEIDEFIDDMEWLNALLLLVAALVGAAFVGSMRRTTALRLPPGPPGWPVVGNLPIFAGPNPHRHLEQEIKKYGPLMSLWMGSQLAVVVSSADVAKEVLKVQDQNFASRPPLAAADNLLFGEGTCGFAPQGPRHQRSRKLIVTELLTGKRIQQFEMTRAEGLSAVIRSILQECGSVVDVHEKTTAVTMNNMTQMMMGKRYCTFEASQDGKGPSQMSEEAAEYLWLIFEINRLLGIPVIGDNIPWLGFLDLLQKRRMRKLRGRLDTFLSRVIAEHVHRQQQTNQTDGGKDFVDVLLSLPEEKGIEKALIIKGILLDMLLAGVDTSAVTAEWAMAELLKNPHVLKKAQEELDRVVGLERQVQEADLPNLPYIEAIFTEALRLHPISALMIPHYSMQATKVGGYDIPANTVVFTHIWAMHRNPAVWEDPLQFKPERFLGRADIDIKGQSTFEMLPFGGGRRGCPGSTLGKTVVTFFLARLLHGFDWSLPNGQQPEDLDMSETFGLILPKTHHLNAVPTPRLPLHLY